MPFQKSHAYRPASGIIFTFFVPHQFMFSFSFDVKEVSHKTNGLRSLSMGQLLSLKSNAFSVLKRESKDIVACRFNGDNLLCSSKNCSFLKCGFITFRTFLNREIIFCK